MNAMAVPWAFFVRDFRLAISYRAGFIFELAGAFVNVILFFYVSQFLGSGLSDQLARYGGDYFVFVIIGIAFTNYLRVGLTAISTKVRDGQLMGTLELLIISPSRLSTVLLSSAAWSHVLATFGVVVYVVFGLLLGPPLEAPNIGLALLAVVIAIVGFNALGLLAAASVIVLKQASGVNWVVSTASVLLAGVFYPSSILPAPLQPVAQALPMTHALEIVRRALLDGASVVEVLPQLGLLVALTAVLLPLGILACRWAVRFARTDGSLTTY